MSKPRGPIPTLAMPVLASVVLAAIAVAPGCGESTSPPAPTEPAGDPVADRNAVVEAHEELLAALEAGDGEAVAAMMDDRHDILVFHPRLETRFDGPEAIASGIASMMGRLAPVDVTEVHLQVWTEGDVAWLTSHMLVESDALDAPFAGRGTEVWVREEGGWKLAHAHWSEHPER